MVAQLQEGQVDTDMTQPSSVKTLKNNESFTIPPDDGIPEQTQTIDGSVTNPMDSSSIIEPNFTPSVIETPRVGDIPEPAQTPNSYSAGDPQTTATTASLPATPQATSQNGITSGADRPLSSSSQISGFSTGSFAGAIVGCAIGAALLASLITFLCMRRRHRKQSLEGPRKLPSDLSEKSGVNPSYYPPPPGPAAGAAAVTVAHQPAWLNHLPYPEDDTAVAHEVAAMLDLISQHVNHYYQDVHVDLTPDLNGKLEAVDSNHLPESIISMLPDSRHPRALIKHCIANEIISRISPTGGNAETFLPEDYVQLPHAISNATNGWRHPASFDSAFSQWRVLTAYLRPPPTSDTMHLDRVESIIKATALRLSNTFAPWTVPDRSLNERQDQLASLMRKGAETGIMIFAQPSTFTFQWASGELPVGAVEVTPALVKSMDEEARWLGRPMMLVQPRVENV